MKTVFTTGKVAKICKVAPRTVSKWFDSGRLKGYRIPGSQDRRIPYESLLAFLREHKMPQAEELEGLVKFRVLTVGLDASLKQQFPNQPDSNVEMIHVDSMFEAGSKTTGSNPPKVVVFDSYLGRAEVLKGISYLKGNDLTSSALVLVIGSEDNANEVYKGADYTFPRPLDPTALTTQLKLYAEDDALAA